MVEDGITQYILDRSFSDHCPILMKFVNADWGPRPFRTLDCWFQDNKFLDVVRAAWEGCGVSGFVGGGGLFLRKN